MVLVGYSWGWSLSGGELSYTTTYHRASDLYLLVPLSCPRTSKMYFGCVFYAFVKLFHVDCRKCIEYASKKGSQILGQLSGKICRDLILNVEANQSIYVMRYHVTRIKSEIIKAQKATKTLGKLNWAIQLSSFLSFVGVVFLQWSKANCISISSLESGEFRSAKKKNIFSPTLYGFRDDAPHI